MAKKYIDAKEFWNRLISVSENDWVGFDTIDEVLSEMSAEPRWIPVTDGLPEEDYETGNGVQFSGDVLATIVNHKNDGELYVWLLKTVDGKWYDYVPKEDGSQDVPDWCEVIAWMLLPEPYKEGEQNE